MRKVIIGAILFSLGSLELSALTATSRTGASKKKIANAWMFKLGKPAESPKKSDNIAKKTDKETFEDFYIAAGVSYSHTAVKSAYSDDTYVVRFKQFDFLNNKFGKFGGSIALGWGQFATGNFYAGCEFLVDINKNKTSEHSYFYNDAFIRRNALFISKVKTSGVVPSLASRFGLYYDQLNTLFFVKVGVARVSSEYKNTSIGSELVKDGFKTSRITPVLGLGVETKVGSIGLRADYDYRFKANKRDYLLSNNNNRMYLRNEVKGYTIRLLLVYNR